MLARSGSEDGAMSASSHKQATWIATRLIECYGECRAVERAQRIQAISVVPQFAAAVTEETRRLCAQPLDKPKV